MSPGAVTSPAGPSPPPAAPTCPSYFTTHTPDGRQSTTCLDQFDYVIPSTPVNFSITDPSSVTTIAIPNKRNADARLHVILSPDRSRSNFSVSVTFLTNGPSIFEAGGELRLNVEYPTEIVEHKFQMHNRSETTGGTSGTTIPLVVDLGSIPVTTKPISAEGHFTFTWVP